MSFNFKTDDSFEFMGLSFTKNERINNENAQGRICVNNFNHSAKIGNNIDGAKFDYFDKDSETIHLRIDDKKLLEFWINANFTLSQLSSWLKEQGVISKFEILSETDECCSLDDVSLEDLRDSKSG